MTRPVVLTGGGTGGHIFPMRAIAEALGELGVPPQDLRYVGSRRGQEKALLGGGPIALTLLPGRGIRRSLAPAAIGANLVALGALAGAMARALYDVGRWRPRVVVSVGGYAAAAVASAAVIWRRPLVLIDLDATASVTHRILARFARVRCVALGDPSPGVVVTGAPVRQDLRTIDRSPEERQRAKARLTPPIDPARRVVVVMTGSLGATRVNRAVVELAQRWRDRDDVALVHVTGRRDYQWVLDARATAGALDYRVVEFAEMSTWWAVADLAICRAGAMTVAELTVVGVPAILVPLPGAPGDHQGHNAHTLAKLGAAVVVSDADCDASRLERELSLLLDAERCSEMARASAALGRPDAARDIAQVVLGAEAVA